jgi:hypothetical protein
VTGFAVRNAGTRIRYTLSKAATVRIVIRQSVAGRRHRGRCVAPTSALRRAALCVRHVVRRTIMRRSGAGATTLTAKRLPPGRYVAKLTATDGGGTRITKTLTFRVAPAPRARPA